MPRTMRTRHVTKLPDCILCQMRQNVSVPARFDSTINGGSWGFLCDGHMAAAGNMAIACRLSDEPEPEPCLKERRSEIMEAISSGDFDLAEDLIGDGDISEWL